jgi:hypothetical protein
MDKPCFSPAGFGQRATAAGHSGQQELQVSRSRSPLAARTPSPVFAGIDFSATSPLLGNSPCGTNDFIDAMMELDYPSPASPAVPHTGVPESPNTWASSSVSSVVPFALKDIPPELPGLDVDDVDVFFAQAPGPTTPGGWVVAQAAALLRRPGQWNFPHADTLFGLAFGYPLAGHFNMRFEVERAGEAGAPGYRLQFGEPQAPYAGRLVLRANHYGVETDGHFHDMPADGDCAFHGLHVLALRRQGYGLRGYIGQTRPDGTIALRVAPGDHSVGEAIRQLRALAADYLTRRADEIGAWLEHPTRPTEAPGMPLPDQRAIDSAPVRATRKCTANVAHYSSASSSSSGSTIAGNPLRRAPRYTRLALPVHIDLMKGLPEKLSSQYRSCIGRLLAHLEAQGQSWSQLVPADSGPGARPPELEEAIRQGIWHHGLHPSTRAAIKQAFGFAIQGESRPITLPPAFQVHLDLLKTLRGKVSQQHYSNVNRLMVYLEEEHLPWSQLVPADSVPGDRPPELERTVNNGIRHHHLHPSTRAAINQAFGFNLRAESGIVQVRRPLALPEHLVLMKGLREKLSPQYRSCIGRLLAYLEARGQSWSQLAPVSSSPGACPPALVHAINEGIQHHGLQPATRAAINQAFGFTIRFRSGLVWVAPALQAHTDLMRALPETLTPAYRSYIKQLLVHLEAQGQSFSQLVSAGSGPGPCPPALEQAVDEGIRGRELHPRTRAAVNQAFRFTLKAGPVAIAPNSPHLGASSDNPARQGTACPSIQGSSSQGKGEHDENLKERLSIIRGMINRGEMTLKQYATQHKLNLPYCQILIEETTSELITRGDRQIRSGLNLRTWTMPREQVIRAARCRGPLSSALKQRMIGDLISDIARYGRHLVKEGLKSLPDDNLKVLYRVVDLYRQDSTADQLDIDSLMGLFELGTSTPEPAPDNRHSQRMSYSEKKKQENAKFIQHMNRSIQMEVDYQAKYMCRKTLDDSQVRGSLAKQRETYDNDVGIDNRRRVHFEESQPGPESGRSTNRYLPVRSATTLPSSTSRSPVANTSNCGHTNEGADCAQAKQTEVARAVDNETEPIVSMGRQAATGNPRANRQDLTAHERLVDDAWLRLERRVDDAWLRLNTYLIEHDAQKALR